MAIQYVGGRGAGRAGSTSTVNVAINSGLTGGIGSAAIAGDLVIVCVAVGSQARNPECGITGYTQLTQQNVTPTTYDTSFRVSYKFMPGTPDTQVTIPATGNTADGQGYTIHVFRGVDPTVPLDGITPTYATGSGTNNRPDPASITPATTGNCLFFGGGGAAQIGTTVFTAAYLSGFLSYNGPDTNDGTCGAGYLLGQVGGTPYNGAAFGGGSVNAANSWCATALVLRPAPATRIADLGVTLAGCIVAAAATLVATAVLAVQLAGATVGSGATVPTVADLSKTLAGTSLSAAATAESAPERIADLGVVLDGASVSSVATTPVVASASIQLAGAYIVSAGAISVVADLAAGMGGAVMSSEATVPVVAAAGINLGGATLQSGGTAPVEADAAVQLAGATVSATASTTNARNAELSVQLAGATLQSDGTDPIEADVAAGLGDTVLSSTISGVDSRTADLSATLAETSLNAGVAVHAELRLAVQLGGASVASAATETGNTVDLTIVSIALIQGNTIGLEIQTLTPVSVEKI
jgi:hypothetical protein